MLLVVITDDIERELNLERDSLSHCIGAGLRHGLDYNSKHPVCHVSRLLGRAEFRYSQIERDVWFHICMAVFSSLIQITSHYLRT